MAEIIKKDQYLMYKGKPLVRDKDIYCYGSMSDEYILFMQVLTYREVDGEQLPDKVIVQIMKTDTSLSQEYMSYVTIVYVCTQPLSCV